MTIQEYMDKKNLSCAEFGGLIGVKSGIVKLWRCGVNSPRLIHALKINQLTKNKVKFSEMLSEKDDVELDLWK